MNLVKIDFCFRYNNLDVWIEYNGSQHYERCDFFCHTDEDFEKQKFRDQNVREYCRINNKLLIEVPYTYKTQKRVDDLLDRVIIQGEDINNIIDYKKLFK